MTNIHRVIAGKRSLSHGEKYVLDFYMTLAIILFSRPLSLSACEFIVTLLRLNNIAQPTIYVHSVQTNGLTGETVRMYHQRIESQIMGGMMR